MNEYLATELKTYAVMISHMSKLKSKKCTDLREAWYEGYNAALDSLIEKVANEMVSCVECGRSMVFAKEEK